MLEQQDNARVFDALDDPSLEQRRIFFGEQHDSSDVTNLSRIFAQNAPRKEWQSRIVLSLVDVARLELKADFFGFRATGGLCRHRSINI